MATNKIKQNLRYQKAHQRLCKEVLVPCPHLRRLLNLEAQQTNLSRFNDHIWKEMYDQGYRAGIDNQNPHFFEYFERIESNQKKIESASKSIERLEKKGFLLDTAKKMRYELNAGRLSQSF